GRQLAIVGEAHPPREIHEIVGTADAHDARIEQNRVRVVARPPAPTDFVRAVRVVMPRMGVRGGHGAARDLPHLHPGHRLGVGDTVITVGVLDVHATGRPVKGLPLASLSVTFSWMVPWSGSVAGAGLTTTVATGTSVTVAAAVPAFPSLVAVIVAVPAATPFTSPLLLTVAILVLLLAHVTVRPVSAVPAESFGVAVSCAVAPTDTLGAAGATATEATGIGVTVIAAVLPLLSL